MIAVQNDMLNEQRSISMNRLCQVLNVPRSTVYYQPRRRKQQQPCGILTNLIYEIIQAFPTFGIRRVWAYLTKRLKWLVNIKKVARIMRLNKWTVTKRRKGGRPRVNFSKSIAARPDERWATDLALVQCGDDGWCNFVPVVDCCTRQVLGWELDRSARAKTAERALEQALIDRFGFPKGAPSGLILRHDNGLVFGSRQYRTTASEYRLSQEFITPYTPEDNGLCERFIRSVKEECAWQHQFASIDDARRTIARYIRWYNNDRPHQAIDYQTPNEQHAAFGSRTAA